LFFQRDLALTVPAVIEFPFVLIGPLLVDVMRRMSSARREIHEEGLVRCGGLLLADPTDRLLRYCFGEMPVRVVVRRFDWRGIFEQWRMPLVRLATLEAVEIIEALAGRPAIVWAADTKLPTGERVIDQEWVQVLLGRAHARVEALSLINWKLATEIDTLSPADASATKVYGSELNTEIYRTLMEVVGPDAVVSGAAGVLAGRLERYARSSLVMTFGGGTNEIQRDIIGMVGLGLPAARR